MKKVLVIESRRLCYDSSQVMMRRFCQALEQCHIQVVSCYTEELQKNIQILESFLTQGFDAVFDVNSLLPGVYHDDMLFLDRLQIPFFHFILDHPMHLHMSLKVPVKNCVVICLDQDHKTYIQNHYPHIRKVLVFPMAGIVSKETIPFSKRRIPVLFPATYIPMSFLEEKVLETSITADQFSQRMYEARFLDRYLRQKIRNFVVDTLLWEGIDLHVIGENWEYYPNYSAKNLHIHKSCSYGQCIDYMADSKVVINVQPLFRNAPHDRITNAMLNGAVSFTDPCTFLQENFADGIEYLSYSLTTLQKDVARLKMLLQNPSHLEVISSKGKTVMESLMAPSLYYQKLITVIENTIKKL